MTRPPTICEHWPGISRRVDAVAGLTPQYRDRSYEFSEVSPLKLSGEQVAVVTGAANGIGKGVAAALSARGLRVVLADIDADDLVQTAKELGGESLTVPTDVADIEQMRRLADRTLAEFGRVDLVVNNAGMGEGGPSWTIAPEAWNRVVSVNLGGVVNGIHVFVPHFVAAGHGHVVNTASLAGLTTMPFGAPYSATKHAIIALSEALQAELAMVAPEVGVTVVCPGPVDTRMLRGLADGAKALAEQRVSSEIPAPPEQLAVMADSINAMLKTTISTADAAEIILAAVEADQLYATTHPEMAVAARDRIDRILAQFGSGNPPSN